MELETPFDYQAKPVAATASAGTREDLVREFRSLCGNSCQTLRAMDDVQSRLAKLEADHARLETLATSQTRVEAPLDVLIRMQQPAARPTYAAQAPFN